MHYFSRFFSKDNIWHRWIWGHHIFCNRGLRLRGFFFFDVIIIFRIHFHNCTLWVFIIFITNENDRSKYDAGLWFSVSLQGFMIPTFQMLIKISRTQLTRVKNLLAAKMLITTFSGRQILNFEGYLIVWAGNRFVDVRIGTCCWDSENAHQKCCIDIIW